MAIHEIKIDGAEQENCRDCVDELRMGGKLEKPKKVGHITVYSTD